MSFTIIITMIFGIWVAIDNAIRQPRPKPAQSLLNHEDDIPFLFKAINNCRTEEHLDSARTMLETFKYNYHGQAQADYQAMLAIWRLQRDKVIADPIIDHALTSEG